MGKNRYVGGKTKPARDAPPKKARPATVAMPCAGCDAHYLTSLLPGLNDITISCDACGAITNVVVRYDGYGNATVIKGTIEKEVAE